jgi:hypothetical protein
VDKKNASIRIWLVASVVAFLGCALATVLFVIFAQRITQYGLGQSIYYLILVVLGLLAAGFLFGALHSYGKYKGKLLSGTLELGGPAVIVVVIILLGLIYASPISTFSLVVRPHGPAGETEVLRSGTVTLFLGTNPRTEQVGINGQAQFNEIPASFLGTKVKVVTDIPGYQLADQGPLRIPGTKVLYVGLTREQVGSELRGKFLMEDGTPVVKAYVDVNQGLAGGYTDEHGNFSIRVPLRRGSIVHVFADLGGTPGYDNTVAISDGLTLTFIPRGRRGRR